MYTLELFVMKVVGIYISISGLKKNNQIGGECPDACNYFTYCVYVENILQGDLSPPKCM